MSLESASVGAEDHKFEIENNSGGVELKTLAATSITHPNLQSKVALWVVHATGFDKEEEWME